jgi:hypothetical protein
MSQGARVIGPEGGSNSWAKPRRVFPGLLAPRDNLKPRFATNLVAMTRRATRPSASPASLPASTALSPRAKLTACKPAGLFLATALKTLLP